MSHDRFHELSALRLYGELSAAEGRALDDHLAQCPECRRFAAELAAGLGRLVPAAAVAAPLPRPRRAVVALAAAAGLVAGIAIGGILRPAPSAPPSPAFARSTAPPPATSPGALASAALALRR